MMNKELLQANAALQAAQGSGAIHYRAHNSKVARLTHKWVLFYEYQGTNKVICAGSLEEITGYIGKREESRKSDLAILASE